MRRKDLVRVALGSAVSWRFRPMSKIVDARLHVFGLGWRWVERLRVGRSRGSPLREGVYVSILYESIRGT